MGKTTLVITSIAEDNHPVLQLYAQKSIEHDFGFILIGDTKSPESFSLNGCSFYGIKDQESLPFRIVSILPYKHYARKNIGYLIAIQDGSEVIVETDDDNIPFDEFWHQRDRSFSGYILDDKQWVNTYKYFSSAKIWPRGFALEALNNILPELGNLVEFKTPIQQGLADKNPDVDAIYRLTSELPQYFNKGIPVGIGKNSICPFNSQNTTWFQEAFPLMYLPSYCSFRMTDIWRSFVAQRIAWENNWPIVFHNATVFQERNEHHLMHDFKDEISGYTNNYEIMNRLTALNLNKSDVFDDLKICYEALISMGLIDKKEMALIHAWEEDIADIKGNKRT
jgi:hypothetical protein